MSKKKADVITLPTEIRAVFERHGVVEAAPVPDLGDLVASVRRMGGSVRIASLGIDAYEATVTMDETAFDAAADDAGLALAQAFASALRATHPEQQPLPGGAGAAQSAAMDEARALAVIGGRMTA